MPNRVLRIGYVPLTDAAPLLVAETLGLFGQHGVQVALSEESAWAAVRDRLAHGLLDGAHLLAPMPIAMASGLGGVRATLSVGAGIGRNGNTFTLSPAIAEEAGLDADGTPLSASAFAALVRRRAAAGEAPLRLAAVFPFSSHHYLLRHWLAAGGLDPDRDLRLMAVPPPRTARALAAGEIDGFCAGEPWGSHAAALGVGRVALTGGDIWPDHPEKVLAFREGLPAEAAVAVTAAVIAAARWLDDPANHEDAARLMQERVFPGMARETVRLAFGGLVPTLRGTRALAAPMRFRAATLARPEVAAWYLGQMRRWGHVPAGVSDAEALFSYDDAIWRSAASLLGEGEPGMVDLPEERAA
ncbi:ABC transporter substrate-binding protein [Muricoccus pecuniae]|uniref:NitT/TauT family transport system ATP-binding protein/nitrate/nitrite transport system substrate-binding protein n=1 Tax=Muricoccus pecuniae TaxID=693023 RepID=A0A840XW80_9PROT|nr:CmpA/NrtA family ABC transporter substrate-binding protein [Roseomonas pecuniae]MBB5693018.1 NitT/TauT family transport system ATP-binding protein/nitrate/nitrite transport system substrate-binding protein [Roseomonas pecuniae]